MTTIIIYDQCGEAALSFYIIDGDKRHLNGTYVNQTEANEQNEEELLELVKAEGLKVFPEDVMGPDTHVIICGFLP